MNTVKYEVYIYENKQKIDTVVICNLVDLKIYLQNLRYKGQQAKVYKTTRELVFSEI